jgi:hypothetical protein
MKDWMAALVALNQQKLDPDIVEDTLGVVLKYRDDVEKVQKQDLQALLAQTRMATDGVRKE